MMILTLDGFVVNSLVFSLCFYLIGSSINLSVKAWRMYKKAKDAQKKAVTE